MAERNAGPNLAMMQRSAFTSRNTKFSLQQINYQVMVAGLMGGAISRLCTAPMDRLRNMMAAGQSSTFIKYAGTANPSMSQGLKAMYNAGGIRAMWQGNGANMLQCGPETALTFVLYEVLKPVICTDQANPSGFEKFLCGSTAGAISMTSIYPIYGIQGRMTVAPERYYRGITDAFVKTIKNEGWESLWKGYTPSLARTVPYKGIDMAGYNTLKELFLPKNTEPTVTQSLTFGGIASCISQTLTHPLLLARTRLQTQGSAGRPMLYNGMLDCIKQTVKQEGVRGIFSGLMPSLIKNVPAIAISFMVYEESMKVLVKHQILSPHG